MVWQLFTDDAGVICMECIFYSNLLCGGHFKCVRRTLHSKLVGEGECMVHTYICMR